MSYKNKIASYQGDCHVLLGKHSMFSDYIKEFSKDQRGHGLDVGAGPQGPNGKFFTHCETFDGCDADDDVVSSLPKNIYTKTFKYLLGSNQKLPYSDNSKDFIVCSCVIQHLSNFDELEIGIQEISRILQRNCQFYLMFKAGTNDTDLTHTNSFYNEVRTFRVFNPEDVINLCQKYNLKLLSKETLLDDNWIPYSCLIFEKN
ncbi:methyltransferase [Indivirus ILV1]|uniref:Methyltransferase n=1 Tax=Indivirus ILV1 TaxID=1977633 RepID=A0A1V0SE26_9VIRU|nr:methyltransferase [Indivirus ILV1]